MNKTLVTLAAIALALLPNAAANHGLTGEIVATLSNGSVAHGSISYVNGDGNTQTWNFFWTTSGGASFNCDGFGSIEVGFTSVNCGMPFSTGPTGDFHGYPSGSADVHQISVSINGVSGTGQQVLCADAGVTALACQLVLGSI